MSPINFFPTDKTLLAIFLLKNQLLPKFEKCSHPQSPKCAEKFLIAKLLICESSLRFSIAMMSWKRTCETNAAGQNSSFIFTVWVRSVPLYHFILLSEFHTWMSNNFLKLTSKIGEIGCLIGPYL